jgi:hypothetical protein
MILLHRLVLAIFVGTLLFALVGCGKRVVDTPTAVATKLLGALQAGQFNQAVARFDPTMKANMSPIQLQAAWQGIISQAGAFKRQVQMNTTNTEHGGQRYDVVVVTCQFERGLLDMRLTINDKREISGLWFVPSQSTTMPGGT